MILAGLVRLGADAELRYTSEGTPVCNLSLAFNYGKKDSGGKKPTQWIDASLWGDRAVALAGYLKKGTTLDVVLEDPHIETYEGRSGTGAKLVARVAMIEFADRGSDGGSEKQGQPAKKPATAAKSGGGDNDFDDDPPF